MDIAIWLRDLGLERYAGTFRDHEIEAAQLPRLTNEHLRELGLPLGPRIKVLEAIAGLERDIPVVAQAATSAASRFTTSAERRQLTVMFVDLVGSTALSIRLDPEEMGEVLRAYREAIAAEVKRFEGHVAKYMGDGVLAYFGWPMIHEHEAERAVRAGLSVVAAVAALPRVAGGQLSARVGIATGPVVVGDMVGSDDAQERSVVGETPNLSARLQGLADPGSVVIAEATRRLLGELFIYRDLGPMRLNGFAEPVIAYQVIGDGAVEDRFEAMHAAAPTTLIGREHELALLLDRWARAKEGEGQVILLSGAAGIGKSRLVRALHERLAAEPHSSHIQFCSPYHGNAALHPAIGLIERAAQFRRGDTPTRQLEKLEAMLALTTEDVPVSASLLADLLAIPTGDRHPVLDLSAQQRKERTFQVLLDQLVGRAARGPALALYEDLHWADPTTLELLARLVERIQHLPVLVLVTSRPGFVPAWMGHGYVVALSLARLSRRQGGAIVDRVSGGKALPAEVLEQILARTDGVPLFVEELTKAVLESGLLSDKGDRYVLEGPLPALAIPATLHDSLMTRLDRLAPAKEVAQLAACIGRHFSYELIAAVSALPAPELDRALDDLTVAELVFPSGAPPDTTYIFKHALLQEAAYQSLLKSRRQQLHARIAAALEELFPDVAESQPDILARHCTEAGLVEKAVAYLHRAAQYSIARWAMAEAITQLQHGLDLLDKLPDDLARRRLELELQTALGVPLMAARGMGVPEVEGAYARARQLCHEIGDAPQLFSVLFGLWWFYELKADLSSALEFAKQLLALARRGNEGAQLVQAHRALACTYFWLGEFTSAQPHFEQAIAHYNTAEHRSLALKYGQEPGVLAQGFASHNLWFLGFPDRALATMNAALLLASEVAQPFSVAFALDHRTWLHQYRREVTETHNAAEADMRFSSEQGLQFFIAHGAILLGWALAEEGDGAAATESMRQGLAVHASTGVLVTRPYWLYLLAGVCGRNGDAEGGLRLLDEASVMLRDQHLWDAELHRLRGELLLLPGASNPPEACDPASRAELCFRQALEIARSQQSKSLELRAGSSLARLWAQNGKRSEARDLLAPIYGWFTEGFGTPDLCDAKALLETLQ